MKDIQSIFFEELANIQDYCISVSITKKENFNNDEEWLHYVVNETIYRVMEVIDGYGENEYKFQLIEKDSGEVVNSNIELHDECMRFLERPTST